MCDSCDFEMPFGKYEGETLLVIRMADSSYLRWVSQNVSNEEVLEAIEEVRENHD